jgi:hypothetical protein
MTVTAPGSQASCKSPKQGRRIGIFSHNPENLPIFSFTSPYKPFLKWICFICRGNDPYNHVKGTQKMKQPPNTKQNFSLSDKSKIILVSIFLALLLLVFGVLLGILIRQSGFKLPVRATPTAAIPTPQCIEPTLTLGTSTLHVKSIPNNPNTFPLIPKDTPDTAYWVEETTINYVFGLSPIGNNLGLNSSLKPGDPAVINWADCSRDEYVIHSLDIVQPNDLNLFDQSSGRLTVYVQTDSSMLVIRGERTIAQQAETPITVATDEFQIDVTLSDQPATDNQTVKMGLIITNKGTQTISLSNNDISLTAENSPEVFPATVEPVLPQQIDPGKSIQIIVTFPKPGASSAVLRILNLTFDYYF